MMLSQGHFPLMRNAFPKTVKGAVMTEIVREKEQIQTLVGILSRRWAACGGGANDGRVT